MSIDGFITTQNLHPDGFNVVYEFEWPKTAADYAKLFSMKSFDLQEIYLNVHVVDGKSNDVL